jgi:hypothetical protein
VRVLFKRGPQPRDGWAEWPGTLPIQGDRWDAIEQMIEEIEASAAASIYA